MGQGTTCIAVYDSCILCVLVPYDLHMIFSLTVGAVSAELFIFFLLQLFQSLIHSTQPHHAQTFPTIVERTNAGESNQFPVGLNHLAEPLY